MDISLNTNNKNNIDNKKYTNKNNNDKIIFSNDKKC